MEIACLGISRTRGMIGPEWGICARRLVRGEAKGIGLVMVGMMDGMAFVGWTVVL